MTAMAMKGGRTATRRPNKRPVKQRSLPTRALDSLPISPRGWERLATWLIVATLFVGVVVGGVVIGVPDMVRAGVADAVSGAGFTVKKVQISGLKHMNRLTVYSIALDAQRQPMTEVDLTGIRAQLMRHAWIAEARVSRRLPDTLVVDIVERVPAAIWQHDGQLRLVDTAGVSLARVSPDNAPDLPLLIGRSANTQAPALDALLGAAPRLRPMIAAATWIGARRWDLQFQTGETLALPEGAPAAAKALTKFEGLDASERLLGRGLLRFDMRDPKRMFVRVQRATPTLDRPAPAPASPPAATPAPAPATAPAPDTPGGVA